MSVKGNAIIEAARAHFKAQLDSSDLSYVEVPEWGTPSDPLKIYYKPMNLEQQNRIYKFVAANSLESLAQTLIERSLDEDGKKLFAPAHKVYFMKEVDPKVIERIVMEMAGDEISDEEIEKNS